MLKTDHILELEELQEGDEDNFIRRFSAADQSEFNRYYYRGKLKVTPSSVDLTRLSSRGGIPFLLNHNPYDVESHVGMLVDAEIKRNVLYVNVKFDDEDPNSMAVMRKIDNGMRPAVSIGFEPDYNELEIEEEDGEYLIEYKKWGLLEVSSVPVPALKTVGKLSESEDGHVKLMKKLIDELREQKIQTNDPVVSLSQDGDTDTDQQTDELEDEVEELADNSQQDAHAEPQASVTLTDNQTQTTAQSNHGGDQLGDENNGGDNGGGTAVATQLTDQQSNSDDVVTIIELGERHNSAELATQAIKDGKNANEFREMLLSQTYASKPHSRSLAAIDAHPDAFSIQALFAHRFNPTSKRFQELAAREIDYSNHLAERFTGPEFIEGDSSLAIPTWAVFGGKANMGLQESLADTGDDAEWIQERVAVDDYLPALIERNPIIGLCDVYPNASGETISIPSITTNPALSYQVTKADTESTDPTDATYATGRVRLEPHQLSMQIPMSRLLAIQTRGYLEQALRTAITNVWALAMSKSIVAGAGSGGEPTGAFNTTGVNAMTHTNTVVEAGGNALWKLYGQGRNKVNQSFADLGGPAYVLGANVQDALEFTPRFTYGDTPCLENGVLHGHPAFHSATFGTAAADLDKAVFGHWNSMKVATWGSMMFIFDNVSKTTTATLRVIGWFDNIAAYNKSFTSFQRP